MKLSSETITVLKNFSTINPSILFRKGNTVSTVSPMKSIFAKVNVKEDFPNSCAIYELNKFLGVLSLFKEPELDFKDNHVLISNGAQSVRYTYASPEMITTPPENDIKFPGADVTFTLTADNLGSILKALSVLSLPEIAIVGDGSDIKVEAVNSKNKTADSYSVVVGKTDKVFNMILKAENLKFLIRDYNVEISRKGISRFISDDVTYWVATEANSTFE